MAGNRHDHHGARHDGPEEYHIPDLSIPENRHEHRDVNVWAVYKFGIALAVLCLLATALLVGLYRYFLNREGGAVAHDQTNVDARSLPADSTVACDLCIVGGGAAGITLAREFIGHGIKVTLLESGGFEPEAPIQALYAGEIADPFSLPLDVMRLRFLGGSTNHWAGYCRPLDAADFTARSVISLKATRYTLRLSTASSWARCQPMASPSRSGSVAT